VAVKSNKDTVINERFKAALKHRVSLLGKTQIEVANKTGIDPRILNGLLKKGASAAMMEEVASKLGIDLLDFLAEGRTILAGEEPEQSPGYTVKGISGNDLNSYDFLKVQFRDDMRLFAGGGGAVEGTYDIDNSPVVIHRNALSLRNPNAKNLIAFRVGGDSMEPTLAKNGIVIADITQNRLDRIHDGDIYAFQFLSDYECAVKRLSLSRNKDIVIIESDNPSEKTVTEEVDNIKLIGRIVWAWREF